MRAFLKQPATSPQEDEEWQAEKALWGINDLEDNEENQDILVWEENWNALMWWLSIPGFLKWNLSCCLGMDVVAVKYDAEMSGRDIDPADYHKLKLIARTVTEELNGRKQQ